MALRQIREMGDPILNKVCRPVEKITDKIITMVDDMFETMYDTNGVGLAAPQIGILRRVVVIDCGLEEPDPIILINPEIIWTSQETQTGAEGCLSVPGKNGDVTRPMRVRVKAYDLEMNEFELEGAGLLARAICHECEHLDGILYVSRVEGELRDNSEPAAEEEE